MSWNKVKIGSFLKRRKDAVEIKNSIEYKRVTIKTKHQGISLRNISKGVLIGTKLQFVVKEGQFLLSKIDARLGAFGIVPEELDEAIITGNFWAFDVDKKRVNIKWFNLFTSSGNFYEICNKASSGTTHRKYLDETKFLSFEINLPDIEEQNSFIERYECYHEKFKELDLEINHQQTYLQQLRQSILQEAVQGKLSEQNPSDEDADTLLKRIKAEKQKLIKQGKLKKEKELPPITEDEIPFELPKGWVWCRLGEVIEFSENLNIENKLSKDTLINYVDIDAIDNQRFVIREPKQRIVAELSSRARRVLSKGYILYSLVRPYLNNIAIVEDTKPNYIGSTGFAVFKGIIVDNSYLKFLLLSEYIRSKYLEMLKGFNSPSITQEQFTSTLMSLPPFAEQQRIVTKVLKLQQQLSQLEAQVQQSRGYAEQLLQAVLKEAFEEKGTVYEENEMVSMVAEE